MLTIPNYKKIVEGVFKDVQNLLIFYPIQGPFTFNSYLKKIKDFSNEVKNDIVFKADSLDISITYANLLFERGVPDWSIKIISCLTETKKLHFICSAFNLILDNREREIYYMNYLGYELISYSKFGDYKNWKKMT
jgi:predicted transglutaminase-like cysteine proteinase